MTKAALLFLIFFLHLQFTNAQWQHFSWGADTRPHSIVSLDQQTALVWGMDTVTYESTILKTTNGGLSFEEKFRESPDTSVGEPGTIFFVDSLHGWAVGWSETILATDDGGESWRTLSNGGFYFIENRAVFFTSPQNGWMVGTDGLPLAIGFIKHTTDGGLTWIPQWGGLSGAFFKSVHFTDDQHGWAVAQRTILRTTNGGNDWDEVDVGTEEYVFYGASFVGDRHGWAVGSDFAAHALIARTVDSGETWEISIHPDWRSFKSVVLIDSTQGWVVGEDGAILTSHDGGSTWEVQESNTGDELVSVDFSGPLHGWACGFRSVLHTTNGGVTSLDEEATKLHSFTLHQNYPNPFNAISNFGFEIAEFAHVSLTIYDVLGQKITTIVNERLSPGSYRRQWDATGQPSGVYFYRLRAGSFVQTKKLLLLR